MSEKTEQHDAREADQQRRLVLSLDGGGSKGFYSLGVLKELEALLGGPLYTHFDLIYGTSTGAIIASLIALEHSVDEIHELYKTHVTNVMKAMLPRGKSDALRELADVVFEEKDFSSFKTSIGIVATNWNLNAPLIFKSNATGAQGRPSSFVPGFGCTISDAVQASCSAYPFFTKKVINTDSFGRLELIDGGFSANNPSLFAITDAIGPMGFPQDQVRVLNVGVGSYPTPRGVVSRVVKKITFGELLDKTLTTSSKSTEQLQSFLFGNIPSVRVSDTFESAEVATDLFETDAYKLDLLWQKGRASFGSHEPDIRSLVS